MPLNQACYLDESYTMLPKMTPLSVEDTLMVALSLVKSCGARLKDCSRSTTCEHDIQHTLHRQHRA